MFRRLGLCLLVTALSAGCGATSLMFGVSEPKLTGINLGDMRAQVERRLGKRLWRAGSADGLTYDIYQFKAGNPPAPVLGIAALLFDVFTLGMSEMAFDDARKFAPVKQLAVAYDEQDHVRFVSQPWPVPEGTVRPCGRMRTLLPVDSGVPSTARPSAIDRTPRPTSQVALFESQDSRIRAVIDGRRAVWHGAELSPGRHTVSFRTRLGGSVLYGATSLSYDVSTEVELLPGRVYRLKHQRFYSWDRRADLFWIEDVHSGETLECTWPEPN